MNELVVRGIVRGHITTAYNYLERVYKYNRAKLSLVVADNKTENHSRSGSGGPKRTL